MKQITLSPELQEAIYLVPGPSQAQSDKEDQLRQILEHLRDPGAQSLLPEWHLAEAHEVELRALGGQPALRLKMSGQWVSDHWVIGPELAEHQAQHPGAHTAAAPEESIRLHRELSIGQSAIIAAIDLVTATGPQHLNELQFRRLVWRTLDLNSVNYTWILEEGDDWKALIGQALLRPEESVEQSFAAQLQEQLQLPRGDVHQLNSAPVKSAAVLEPTADHTPDQCAAAQVLLQHLKLLEALQNDEDQEESEQQRRFASLHASCVPGNDQPGWIITDEHEIPTQWLYTGEWFEISPRTDSGESALILALRSGLWRIQWNGQFWHAPRQEWTIDGSDVETGIEIRHAQAHGEDAERIRTTFCAIGGSFGQGPGVEAALKSGEAQLQVWMNGWCNALIS